MLIHEILIFGMESANGEPSRGARSSYVMLYMSSHFIQPVSAKFSTSGDDLTPTSILRTAGNAIERDLTSCTWGKY